MAKNRYAQLLYGKVLYIFETDLKFNELSTIFDPSTYWVDVTGMDCEVGYIAEFKGGAGIVLVPPPNQELTFEELKAAKLAEVDVWTENKITGGFISSCTGAPVRYDSDRDTQMTVQGDVGTIAQLPEVFAENFPDGYPMRGYAEGSEEKGIFLLTIDQLNKWSADLSMHRGNSKKAGWEKQAEVMAAESVSELDKIILD